MSAFGRSSLLVLSLFAESHSSLMQNDIRNRTGLSTRSVKYALKELEKSGLVLARTCFGDTRRKVYRRASSKTISSPWLW